MSRISYTRRQVCQLGLSTVAGLTLLDLAGCGGSSSGGSASETMQLSFWGPASRNKLTQSAIKAFQQEHSNISIRSWFADFSVYFNQLNTQIASGTIPDLIQMDMSYLAQYVNEHELLDLSSFVNDKTIDLSDFDQGMLANSEDNGVNYGISLGGNYECLIYDATLVQEAGVGTPPTSWTWDQFATYTRDLSKALASKSAYGTPDASGAIDMFEIWVRQRGRELWTTDGKVAFTVDDVASWFSYWDGLRKSGACAPAQLQASVTGSGPSASLLAKGKAVFATGHSNQFSSYQALTKNQLVLQTVPTGAGPGNYLKPSMLMSV
jgi:multiple sugar transport system substrate-binding protein